MSDISLTPTLTSEKSPKLNKLTTTSSTGSSTDGDTPVATRKSRVPPKIKHKAISKPQKPAPTLVKDPKKRTLKKPVGGAKTDGLEQMISRAWEVRENAYCPYSGFKVGSTLRSKKTGKIYQGCNVEAAAYPSGVCAERNAICQAVAAEGPDVKFDHCVVVAESDGVTFPCGFCRQSLVEFGTELKVTCVSHKGDSCSTTLGELLPHSFGPHSFKPKSAF